MMSFIFPGATELALLITGLLVLIIDVLKKKRETALFIVSLIGLAVAAASSLARLRQLIPADATYIPPSDIVAYHGLMSWDALSQGLTLAILLMSALAFIYGRRYLQVRNILSGEYYALVLFSTLGMSILVAARHFLTIYLGLELMSLSLYALVALPRDSSTATEAAMKYFVLGALASGLLLFGMSLIYGATGQLQLDLIAQTLPVVDRTQALLGLIFIIAGIAFKLGVVPFHMWLPDVYQGAPTATVLFISAGPKIAAFGMLVRILIQGTYFMTPYWQNLLIVLAALSILLGNVAAIAQKNFKRMLAYSSITHMGYMLLGIVAGMFGDQPAYLTTAYGAALFYILSYALMSAGTFGILMQLTRSGIEADQIRDYCGLHQRSPLLAAMMALMMFSVAGLPFFLGFFAKFTVLQSLVLAGTAYHQPHFIWLAVLAVMCSLIGSFFYLRIVKFMYFDAPQSTEPLPTTFGLRLIMVCHVLVVAFLGIFSQNLLQLCAFFVQSSLLHL